MSSVEIFSVAIILFAVIDIIGAIPIILDIYKKNNGQLDSFLATVVAGALMFIFLFVGVSILNFFAVDLGSFAVAGAVVLFILGLEMVLGREFFKHDDGAVGTSSIVPLAFPLIAGAGSMTTLISLRAQFELINIVGGILINLIIVYIVLSQIKLIVRILNPVVILVLRKFFGIILLAMGVKLFTSNFSLT